MSGLEDLYREIILDHYRSPRNRGELAVPPAHRTDGFNPLCGDEIVVYLELDDASKGEGATVTGIKIAGQGCSISQASASVMSEMVTGADPSDADTVRRAFVELMHSRGATEPDEDVLGDGVAFVGVAKYPARIKCALLPWMALQDAEAKAGIGLDQEETPS